MADMEYKATPAEFKAVGDKGEYQGHFSVFSNIDDGGDIVHPGAFAKTIQERGKRCKVFLGHDWEKLLGPPPDVLQEDTTGLNTAGHLTLGSFWGNEAWALLKDGALTEGSIGYEPVVYDYSEPPDNGQMVAGDSMAAPKGAIRNLREVKLYEISFVPLGMNALTQIRAVKAAVLAAKGALPADGGQHTISEVAGVKGYIEALTAILAQTKEGRILSGASKEKVNAAVDALSAALDALNGLLAAAEPPKALDTARLVRRIRAAELALELR